MKTQLLNKIHGCIAASWAGSSMGAVTEGLTLAKIKEKYGILQEFVPYVREGKHFRRPGGPYYDYYTDEREPGMTEDGIERQKLITLTIRDKNGRITVDDYAKGFLKYIRTEYFGHLTEPTDEMFYGMLKGGVPPASVGLFSWWPGLGAIARSIHPVGIINACNPEQAARDARDVARLVQPAHGLGWDYPAAVAAGIAEALRPNATVESVVNVATSVCIRSEVRDSIIEDIALAEGKKDIWELRDALQKRYGTHDHRLGHVLLGTAFAIFVFTKGNAKEAIIAGTNTGIDTDCVSAVAGGLCGALNGPKDLPQDWIATMDLAAKNNQKTVSNFTTMETAEILYNVLMTITESTKKQLSEIETQL